jgi:3D (Asp-Asp-Asp) domain-containing protein
VEDRGGAINGNHIDIYFNTHEEALEFGCQYANVYLVN